MRQQLKRPCKKCDKTYQPTGKFQTICEPCFKASLKGRQTHKPITNYCKYCGGECAGYLKIELRKGIYSSFCTNCFSLLYNKDIKEIRKLIKPKDLNS